MTSAPSITDIGFSGIRRAKSTSADQPVASAIGSSGTNARCERAEGGEQHERDGEQARQQRHAARRHGEDTAALASAASTGRPASSASMPAGGCSAVAHRPSMHVLLAVERHQADAEGQRGRAPVGA